MSHWQCRNRYDGPSYPEAHGTECRLPLGHDDGEPHRDQKHRGTAPNGLSLEWFTEAQKQRRAAMKAEAKPAAGPP